uniref:Serine/threonine-protein kinase TAO1 n=1 Tax=Talaromyces marneffei PM1 TaxID=1077442 RepID=A0A093VA23_TALMA
MAFCITFGTYGKTPYLRFPLWTSNRDLRDTKMFEPIVKTAETGMDIAKRDGRFSQSVLFIRPDITPTTQPPPGMSWGPAYGPPQQPQYAYQGGQQPPAGYQSGPPVASGGNQDAGHVYK